MKIPPSNQVFYFLPELYAFVCSMPVVLMELTVPGVISFGWVRPHLKWSSQELFMLYLAQDLCYCGCQGGEPSR